MTRIAYYFKGQSDKRYVVKVDNALVDDTITQLKATGHIISNTYIYKPTGPVEIHHFAVRVDRGPILHESLTKEEAEELAAQERLDRPGYTILVFNKAHSEGIKKMWDRKKGKN